MTSNSKKNYVMPQIEVIDTVSECCIAASTGNLIQPWIPDTDPVELP